MYNPEDDIVPAELLTQSSNLSQNIPNCYKVYFDKDTGDILSITNEENANYLNFIEFEYADVSEFLTNKKNISHYKLTFVDINTPQLILKNSDDINTIILTEVPLVDNWDNVLTIENYVILKKWGIQLSLDRREIFKNYNLNTTFEIFIVDEANQNFIYRTLKVSLKELLETDRVYFLHESTYESLSTLKIFVKKFFNSYGYQVLYDIED
jgi:hypothetical protein